MLKMCFMCAYSLVHMRSTEIMRKQVLFSMCIYQCVREHSNWCGRNCQTCPNLAKRTEKRHRSTFSGHESFEHYVFHHVPGHGSADESCDVVSFQAETAETSQALLLLAARVPAL